MALSTHTGDTLTSIFYIFESRRDTSKDDVIFWTNFGPGCSSAISLFMELGPCTVVQDGEEDAEIKLRNHPQSWNEFLIVDQPVGVGFSYVEHREQVVSCFVVMFFLLNGCDNPV